MALINYLTRIHFADGVLEDALGEELRHSGIVRPLVIVDAGSNDDAYARVLDALPPRTSGIRFAVAACADVSTEIARAVATFSDMDCDAYIGLGGASAISLARRAAYANGTKSEVLDTDRLAQRSRRGRDRSRAFAVSIPTNTECVGLFPLLDLPCDRTRRQGASDTAMLPDLVLCDPTLTLATDKRTTAAAGMDTLTHCIEAFLGTTWNPPADGIALDGIRRASASLWRAVDRGSDLAARRNMMAAALNAGLASQKGLGAAHALALALESEIRLNAPHGYFHAALLPAVLTFNAPAIETRLSDLREALNVQPEADLPDALLAFGAEIELPRSLESLALDRAMRKRIADRAVEDPASQTNPRHATAADYIRMLECAS